MEETNTSGLGSTSEVPEEIKGWSWGAFLFTWIWGIGNNTYRAFWVLFPFFGIIMMIFLGFKGREWAWKHKKWISIDHFNRVQKQWSLAAAIFIVAIVLLFGGLFYGVMSLMKGSDVYQQSFAQVSTNTLVQEKLGDTLESSALVSGNIQMDGASGYASLSYGIEGIKGEADVYVEGEQQMGLWKINCLDVVFKEPSERISLIPCDYTN